MTSFVEQIAPLIQKHAPKYNIKVVSPIIAQAILESASGTSELAVKAHNYFGLKYRKGRCPTATGIYQKVGSEQMDTGLYVSSVMQWCKFPNMEDGVIGYFDFINVANYANLKGITSPEQYLINIKKDGYATSKNYVQNLMNVIGKYGLTKYDKKGDEVMAYTNSGLVTTKLLAPYSNTWGARTHAIDTITIHCTAGQGTAYSIASIFQPVSRRASCNYSVGYDGSIGLVVEEKNASGCTSNKENDERAITIEVSTTNYHPYQCTDKAYDATIRLVADICKRNGIKQLKWSTNKSDRVNHRNGCNMTVHRDYENKPCPGDYLYNRMGDIASKVNAMLAKQSTTGTMQQSALTKVVYDYTLYETFVSRYYGKSVDVDGAFGPQCFDYVAQYAKVLGHTLPNCTQTGYVRDIANLKATNGILKWCDDIALNGQEMKKGDIIIWDGGQFPLSHIAIYTGRDSGNNGIYLGQNQPYPYGNERVFTSANMIGCFRPKVFKKTEVAEGNINYRVHCQTYGWLGYVYDGKMAGTTGKAKRMEALQIYTTDGTVIEQVDAHMQSIGWKSYKAPNKSTIIGTTGQAKRLEALRIKTSKPCKMRGHVQKQGWGEWVDCDGKAMIGTTGKSLRLEAIEIKRV